jgi:ribosomal protein S18 acetylase RimI-like enzyme
MFSLRPMQASDGAFSYRVYASTRLEELAPLGWSSEQKEAFLHMQFEAQTQSYRLQFPQARYEIILQDGVPAGRLLTDRTPEDLLLIDIALLPDFRGRGIGSGIVRRLQAEAAQAGQSVRLHVETFNPARRLYERLGFVKTADQGIHQEMRWQPAASPESSK